MLRTTVRTARKVHVCTTLNHLIHVGEQYLEHVASPDHDLLGNVGWWRIRECAGCAERYGRMIEDMTL